MGAVQDIHKGWDKFVKEGEFFVKHEVVFGWIDGSKDRKDGEALNNATIATIHEYGSEDGRIPEGRLGLRAWVDSHQDDIGNSLMITDLKPGWLLYIDDLADFEGYSDTFLHLLETFHDLGFRCLRLDPDGNDLDDLPTFEW